MNEQSTRTLFVLGGLLAAVTIVASYWFYTSNLEQLRDAQKLVACCQSDASQIMHLRELPHTAVLTSRSVDDLGTTIERAANDAQLARDRVLRIDPQAPKRIAKTDYLEQTTEVELVTVSLPQLINFLVNMKVGESDLGLNTLRLQVPHSTANNPGIELWSADIVLTQRVYAPTTPHR